jgi:hypothetical protein
LINRDPQERVLLSDLKRGAASDKALFRPKQLQFVSRFGNLDANEIGAHSATGAETGPLGIFGSGIANSLVNVPPTIQPTMDAADQRLSMRLLVRRIPRPKIESTVR